MSEFGENFRAKIWTENFANARQNPNSRIVNSTDVPKVDFSRQNSNLTIFCPPWIWQVFFFLQLCQIYEYTFWICIFVCLGHCHTYSERKKKSRSFFLCVLWKTRCSTECIVKKMCVIVRQLNRGHFTGVHF